MELYKLLSSHKKGNLIYPKYGGMEESGASKYTQSHALTRIKSRFIFLKHAKKQTNMVQLQCKSETSRSEQNCHFCFMTNRTIQVISNAQE